MNYISLNIASDQLPTWKLVIVLLKYLNLFTSFYSHKCCDNACGNATNAFLAMEFTAHFQSVQFITLDIILLIIAILVLNQVHGIKLFMAVNVKMILGPNRIA